MADEYAAPVLGGLMDFMPDSSSVNLPSPFASSFFSAATAAPALTAPASCGTDFLFRKSSVLIFVQREENRRSSGDFIGGKFLVLIFVECGEHGIGLHRAGAISTTKA